jgi:hypothetical protein
MPDPHEPSESLEAMAFQLVLQKLTTLEHALQRIPPLLTKIIAHLEAQTPQAEVEIATYAQLYPEMQEAADSAPVPEAAAEQTPALPAPRPRARLWRWFLKES